MDARANRPIKEGGRVVDAEAQAIHGHSESAGVADVSWIPNFMD